MFALKTENQEKGKLTKKENLMRGKIHQKVFNQYFKNGGVCLCIIMLVVYVFMVSLRIGADYWVGTWNSDKYHFSFQTNLIIYALLLCGMFLFGIARSVLWAVYTAKIAFKSFDDLLKNMLKKPMSFFDTTPSGQLLNLFSKDTDILDTLLPLLGTMVVTNMFLFLGSLALAAFSNLVILPMVLLTLIAFFYFVRSYLNVNREFKRFELLSYSPLISNLLENYQGLQHFRNYHQVEQRERVFMQLANHLNNSLFHLKCNTLMFLLYTEFIMIFFILVSFSLILVGVVHKWSIIPSEVSVIGVTLSYLFNIPNFIVFLSLYYTEFVQAMESFERILYNVDNQVSEDGKSNPGKSKLQLNKQSLSDIGNPRIPFIQIQNIKCRYRDTLPLVLNGLDIEIFKGQSVAIVGRTGSGKSSLLLALTRLINIENNRYFKDIALSQKINTRVDDYQFKNTSLIQITDLNSQHKMRNRNSENQILSNTKDSNNLNSQQSAQ